MDAITRISAFFPTNTLTVYFIMSNVIINDSGSCMPQQRQLMIALLVIFCILNVMACFTDTYTASNQQKFWVFIIPFYGPLCFSLPTDYDKDRVYEFYYLKIRDYVHAFASLLTFLLVIIFTNPICMCLFPGEDDNGTSRFDAAIVRTVPVIVSIIMALSMVCLGPPRQMLGFQNVPETAPPLERQLNDNPIYKDYPPREYCQHVLFSQAQRDVPGTIHHGKVVKRALYGKCGCWAGRLFCLPVAAAYPGMAVLRLMHMRLTLLPCCLCMPSLVGTAIESSIPEVRNPTPNSTIQCGCQPGQGGQMMAMEGFKACLMIVARLSFSLPHAPPCPAHWHACT